MKKTLIALIYVAIALILVYILPMQSSANEPLLYLISPNGDEILSRTITIKWYAYDNECDNQEDLPIYLYYKSTNQLENTYQTIAEHLPNTGIYNWSIKGIENGEYQILIESLDTHNNLTCIVSKPFTVQNTFSMITSISIQKHTDMHYGTTPVIKNGDTITVTAILDCIEPIESSDIYANLTALGGATQCTPTSFNGTTASWIIAQVYCPNNGTCNISIVIKNECQKTMSFQVDNIKPEVHLIYPDNGVYLFNRRIFTSNHTFIFGSITFTFHMTDNMKIERGDFYIDEWLYGIITREPYRITLHDRLFGTHNITLIVYDIAGNTAHISKTIHIFNFM